jgi:penicillin-binding protein 1A
MIRAVANRPVENFETEVKPPDWQQEPDDEAWYGAADNGQQQQFVDPDGNPLPSNAGVPPEDEDEGDPRPRDQAAPPPEQRPERLDRDWLDRAINGDRPRREPGPSRRPPVAPPPAPRPSPSGGDAMEPRAATAQP